MLQNQHNFHMITLKKKKKKDKLESQRGLIMVQMVSRNRLFSVKTPQLCSFLPICLSELKSVDCWSCCSFHHYFQHLPKIGLNEINDWQKTNNFNIDFICMLSSPPYVCDQSSEEAQTLIEKSNHHCKHSIYHLQGSSQKHHSLQTKHFLQLLQRLRLSFYNLCTFLNLKGLEKKNLDYWLLKCIFFPHRYL